jgi:mannose-1-phosphate guanylyltransferase
MRLSREKKISHQKHMNIVIMAGGGGTRLWPVSREKLPKQFTQLFGRKTLLEHTFDRALSIVRRPEQIVVTTRENYAKEIRRQLPRLPKSHILVEAVKRDTAPSIGMAAAFFAAQGKHDEPLLMLPSDHYLQHEGLFRRAIRAAESFLAQKPGVTVLLGSWPTYPETGLGYIELGTKRVARSGFPFTSVKRFREKPPLPLAKRFLASGNFVWNMGVYGWRVSTLLDLFHRCAPAIAKRLDTIEGLFRDRASSQRIAAVYRTMPSISIDFAVTEHQDPATIYVLPGKYGWSDVGHWGALRELLSGKEGLEMKRGVAAQVHALGNFVYNTADAAVGLAGVNNLIVVSTPDAVLICDKKHVQDVKKLVEELERRGHRRFL